MILGTNALVRPAGWLLAVAVVLTLAAPGTGSACDKNKTAVAKGSASCPVGSAPCAAKSAPAACGMHAEATMCCGSAASKPAVARRATTPKRVKRLAPASRVATAPAANVASAPAAPAKAPGTAGLVIAIDPETGTVGQPTAEQFRALSAESKVTRAEASLSGRPELMPLPGGGTLARLNGRFMQFSTVRVDDHGKIHYDCGADPSAPVTKAPTAAAPRFEEK